MIPLSLSLVHRNDNTFDNHCGNNISERSFGIGNRQRPSTTALMACKRASEMAFIRFSDLPGIDYSLYSRNRSHLPFLTLYSTLSPNDRPKNMKIYVKMRCFKFTVRTHAPEPRISPRKKTKKETDTANLTNAETNPNRHKVLLSVLIRRALEFDGGGVYRVN